MKPTTYSYARHESAGDIAVTASIECPVGRDYWSGESRVVVKVTSRPATDDDVAARDVKLGEPFYAYLKTPEEARAALAKALRELADKVEAAE